MRKTATRQTSGSGRTAVRRESRAISRENVDALFRSVGQKLREGLSGEAERILIDTIDSYQHSAEDLANLKRLLAFTLETAGRYKESLETIQEFAENADLSALSIETQLKATIQLAIAVQGLGHPQQNLPDPMGPPLPGNPLKHQRSADMALSGV